MRRPSVRAGHPRGQRRLVPRHLPFIRRLLRRRIPLGFHRNRLEINTTTILTIPVTGNDEILFPFDS